VTSTVEPAPNTVPATVEQEDLEIPTREATDIVIGVTTQPAAPIPAPATKKTATKKKMTAKKKTATKQKQTPVVESTEEVSVCVQDDCHSLAQLKIEYNGGYAKSGHLLFGVGCSNCLLSQVQPSGKEPVHLNNTKLCSFTL
jgi:hypothetical protein